MLKEVEHWLKRAANGLRSNALEGFSAVQSNTDDSTTDKMTWNEQEIDKFDKSHFASSAGFKDNVQGGTDRKTYAQRVIDEQIKPLKTMNHDFSFTDSQINANYNTLNTNMAKYNVVLDQLNEVPNKERRTINVGTSNENINFYTVPNIDSSYQRIAIPDVITSLDFPGKAVNEINQNDQYSIKIQGKSLRIEKITNNGAKGTDGQRVGSAGWNETNGYGAYGTEAPGLKFNIIVEETRDRKYYHKKEDGLELGREKSHREKHMADTKELLLYTNQSYIIGTITTALALIFTYRNFV